MGLLVLLVSSCQNSAFEQEFDCNTPIEYSQTKTYKDVLSHFKVKIPKSWKTELYYDEYQSKLYTADTTKSLRETFIIDMTWHQGELLFNKDFEVAVAENASQKLQLVPVKSGHGDFLGKPAFYHISTGKSESLNWHYLEVYIRYNVDEYYTMTSKIYGNEFVTERICASFGLFKTLEFID